VLGYSPDYLSDLLREETGESARDHIHRALIEAAKRRLAASSQSVSEIAYALGFEQPQHFSKLFKQKTGASPGQWRSP
jgi:AraC-like DNA-binding protein